MSCIVQQLQPPQPVTVSAIGDCCANIITPVNPINIVLQNVTAHILTGRVLCGTPPTGIANVIVVASITAGTTTSYYVGLTNITGDYSICVPSTGTYSVQAYKCCCNAPTTSPANCDCTVPSTTPSN
ncbi:hypothetical protein [Clostridium sp.]|uniref:hypothetical protein n=1 Tax=Clostridium sp. TaxID=1506 RepID=UPI00262A8FFE|nr:hypothetical protein [Clostridium sp.]